MFVDLKLPTKSFFTHVLCPVVFFKKYIQGSDKK